jgi:DNA invertase Pin-like site-specific DNA recombinase
MKIGYARVSKSDQNLSLQIDALKKYGCDLILEEKVSGKNTERPQLEKLLEIIADGHTVVVWKLDRLGRSIKDLINLVELFKSKNVNFVSLNDHIDTGTAAGRLTFNIFASLAEFERDMIRERTFAGLAAAKARGRTGGRPKGLSKKKIEDAKMIKTLFESGSDMESIKTKFKISRATIYRYVNYIKNTEVNLKH